MFNIIFFEDKKDPSDILASISFPYPIWVFSLYLKLSKKNLLSSLSFKTTLPLASIILLFALYVKVLAVKIFSPSIYLELFFVIIKFLFL